MKRDSIVGRRRFMDGARRPGYEDADRRQYVIDERLDSWLS
jgi:hypothetical protein